MGLFVYLPLVSFRYFFWLMTISPLRHLVAAFPNALYTPGSSLISPLSSSFLSVFCRFLRSFAFSFLFVCPSRPIISSCFTLSSVGSVRNHHQSLLPSLHQRNRLREKEQEEDQPSVLFLFVSGSASCARRAVTSVRQHQPTKPI